MKTGDVRLYTKLCWLGFNWFKVKRGSGFWVQEVESTSRITILYGEGEREGDKGGGSCGEVKYGERWGTLTLACS